MFKPLFITTIVLIFVGGFLFFFQEQNNSTNLKNSNFFGQKLLEELDTKELNKIHIRGENSLVSLIQLEGGGWIEESLEFEADFSAIQDLLLRLSEITLGDQVTNNPDHHRRFSLMIPPENIEKWEKEFHGTSVSLLKGDDTIILSLLLGKNRENGEGQYIRHNGSDKVFLIQEKLFLNTNINDWLDKNLLKIDEKQVKSIKIEEGSEINVNLNRKSFDEKWVSLVDGSLPDNEKIQNLLDRLSNLSFSKILLRDKVNENKSVQLEKVLSVTLFKGEIFKVKIQKDKNSTSNYILNLRMGILQEASGKKIIDETRARGEMESFNQKMNGRFFEISSWEGKELLMNND